MQSKDLQEKINLLEIQVRDYENRLDQAFSENIELKETKKIYHELRLLREKLAELSEVYKSDDMNS